MKNRRQKSLSLSLSEADPSKSANIKTNMVLFFFLLVC